MSFKRNGLSKVILKFYLCSLEPLVIALCLLTLSDLGCVTYSVFIFLIYKVVVIVPASVVARKLKWLSIYKVPRTVPGPGQT